MDSFSVILVLIFSSTILVALGSPLQSVYIISEESPRTTPIGVPSHRSSAFLSLSENSSIYNLFKTQFLALLSAPSKVLHLKTSKLSYISTSDSSPSAGINDLTTTPSLRTYIPTSVQGPTIGQQSSAKPSPKPYEFKKPSRAPTLNPTYLPSTYPSSNPTTATQTFVSFDINQVNMHIS